MEERGNRTGNADPEQPADYTELVQLTRKRAMSEPVFNTMVDRLDERRSGIVVAGEPLDLYAESVAESAFGAGGAAPDCRTCGACCACFQQIPIVVEDATPRRFAWTVWDADDIAGPKSHWLRREPSEGFCVAFIGTIGASAACGIYELRPHACRAFESGSDRCRAVRRAYGLEAPLSHSELAERNKRLNRTPVAERVELPDAATPERRSALLREMIDYASMKVVVILAEARRLHNLLVEDRVPAASDARRILGAISTEAHRLDSAVSRLWANLAERPAGAGSGDELLEIAALSQEALHRTARYLLALGEMVAEKFVFER